MAGWQAALLNSRTYLLAAAYAACFGVELTVANIVSLYLYNQFHLTLTTAGIVGESYQSISHWTVEVCVAGLCMCKAISTALSPSVSTPHLSTNMHTCRVFGAPDSQSLCSVVCVPLQVARLD